MPIERPNLQSPGISEQTVSAVSSAVQAINRDVSVVPVMSTSVDTSDVRTPKLTGNSSRRLRGSLLTALTAATLGAGSGTARAEEPGPNMCEILQNTRPLTVTTVSEGNQVSKEVYTIGSQVCDEQVYGNSINQTLYQVTEAGFVAVAFASDMEVGGTETFANARTVCVSDEQNLFVGSLTARHVSSTGRHEIKGNSPEAWLPCDALNPNTP